MKFKKPFLAIVLGAVALSFLAESARATIPRPMSSVDNSIRSYWNGLCAGVGGSTLQDHSVIQWTCNGKIDEKWYFSPTTDNNGGRAYILYNEYSGMCMGVGSSLSDGATVIQHTCNGAIDEKWWVQGYSVNQLVNVYSGKCLASANSLTAGTHLIQYRCDLDYADQNWTLTS